MGSQAGAAGGCKGRIPVERGHFPGKIFAFERTASPAARLVCKANGMDLPAGMAMGKNNPAAFAIATRQQGAG